MNQEFQLDYYRMTGKKWNIFGYLDYFLNYDLRYLHYLRVRRGGAAAALRNKRWASRYGLEILTYNIGSGLYLSHAHNINVNPNVVIGRNCNLSKGVSIGVENRGERKGTPVLGDNVWVGTNAVIVGKVHIGNDVLIAANAFVNFDVPDHSVVVGNPGVIHPRMNATEGYVCSRV